MHRIIDSQMQSNRTVATPLVGTSKEMRQQICAFCDICVLIPREAVAGYSCGIARVTVINSQMQRIYLSAAIIVSMSKCVVARRSVGSAVPGVGLASCLSSSSMYRIVDDQMQSNRRIATPLVSTSKEMRQQICAFCDICVLIPSKALASNSHGIAGAAVIDSQ